MSGDDPWWDERKFGPLPIPHQTPRYEDGEPLEEYEKDQIETRYENDVTKSRDEDRY